MIEWRLRPEDVARIRFAFSPLWELVLSLVALQAPAEHSLHQPWIRATRPLLADLDLSEVYAIARTTPWGIADFITPSPSGPQPDIAAELGRVRRTDAARVRADLEEVSEVPAAVAYRIRADPDAATSRIADTLQAYWDLALSPHWRRILRLLEADVLWRSQRLAAGGLAALFEDLHPSIALDGDRLRAADPYDWTGNLDGRGLMLVPHAMGWPRVRKMTGREKPGSAGHRYQPMIAYPVRGIATLWETMPAAAPDALAALLGRTRASILIALAEPIDTSSLARRMRLTPGAISQHLSVLHDAGLASRTRVAGRVLYRRTPRGDLIVE